MDTPRQNQKLVPVAPPTQQDSIDLMEILKTLWDHAVYIVIAALIGGCLSLGYTYLFVMPRYSASTTIFVNTSSISLGSVTASVSDLNLTTSDEMVDIYITILGSRETLKEIADAAGVEYDYDRLKDMISASQASGSGIFKVTVSSSSATEAELLANTVAKVLPDRISDIVDGTSVRVVEYAVVPTSYSSPDYLSATITGVLCGAVFACAIIFLFWYLRQAKDTAIGSADDLENLYPDIPLLGTVPDMRQEGKGAYGKGYGYGYGYGYEPSQKKRSAKHTAKGED